MMKKNLMITAMLVSLSIGFAGAQSGDVSISSLLDEMVSFESAALYPDYACRQQSSYDRRSLSPGNANWFANDDGFGFIRTETNDGRTEKVLFEDTGAGAITRIWMTTQNRNGTLRFYFDGNTTAGWTIPAYDMLQAGLGLGLGLCQPHINNETGGKGGSSFFFPITYAQSCKVTLEEPSPTFSTPRYYHFNYRKYPDGTSVEPFSTSALAALTEKIQSVNGQLLNPPTFSAGTNTNRMKRLSPGDSITLILPQGTNIVRALQVAVSSFGESQYRQLMRGLVLEALFDGVQTVRTPLGDFSGGGMGAPSVESWYLTSNGSGNIVSRWVMPYQNGGEIRIVNYSGYNADVYLQANTDSYTWRENSLYFHASWRQETEIPLTKWDKGSDYLDWNFATLNGRGVYRGDVLSLFNYAPRWYGEGDEKIFVDGEAFPSHFGTGTEDYYNCSWAPVTPFQTPFGGAPRADNVSSHGYNTFFRTRNLDAIPFAERLKFDIEMLSWDPGMADYATTVFWYGDSDAAAEGLSGVEEATRELFPDPPAAVDYIIPNSFEFEELEPEYISPAIRTETQMMTPFQGKWSKAAQLLCRGAQTNDYLLYRFAGYNSAKRYRIQVQGTKAVDFGILVFSVNGSSSYTVDFYNNGVIHTGVILLGSRFSPDSEGVFEIKIAYNGKNSSSTGNLIGLDCIQFIEEDFKVAGAIEFETLNFTNKSGFTNNFPQGMGNYPNGKWGNKTQQVFQGGKKGDYIDYTFGDVDAGKTYQLTLYATKGPDFATLSFAVNGETLPVRFDGFHELVHDSGPIELGEFAAKSDGSIDFRVDVTGTNPYSGYPYYIVGLDCIALEKKSGSGGDNQPLMGWSSWNANRININEALIKETADSIVSLGLKDYGYSWVNIDDGFFNGRNAEGHLQVNSKFPNGMKAVSDYIHAKGLNAGIYSEIGRNTCASIYDGDQAGNNSGLYEHEEQDLRLFFDTWNYDFIKVDYCGGVAMGLAEQPSYTNVGNIIAGLKTELNRKLRYNICRWSFPGTWARDVADSWRISGDIGDNFASIHSIIELNTYLAPYCSPGKYNDMDMLQLGRGLNNEEEKTHFGMWAIMSSPLVIGCNFAGIRQSSLDILKNAEIIAVNQDALGLQAEVVAGNGKTRVFAKPVETAHGKVRAVALYNPGATARTIRVNFKDIWLSEKAQVRDLWTHTDLGEFTDYYETLVPAHGTAMLRIEGESAIDKLRYQGEYAYMNKFAAINLAENARFERVNHFVTSGGAVMHWLGNSADNRAEYRDVYVSQGGNYTFKLYYISAENRNLTVTVNGVDYQMTNLNSGGWDRRATAEIQITLNAGSNVIHLANATAFAPNIDKFELIPEGGSIDEDSFDWVDTDGQFPVVSDNSGETWYNVQFKGSEGVLQDMGEDQFLLTKALDETLPSQLWKVVQASNPSGEYKYQLVSRDGRALVRVSVPETADGFYKTTSNAADWVKFRIPATNNNNLKPAWEMERQGANNRRLNQYNPTQSATYDKYISEWTADDQGNPLIFVPAKNSTAIKKTEVKDIRIYPNPASDQLIIDGAQSIVNDVAVYDISGRKMANAQRLNAQSLDISALPDGMYLLKIETESGNKTLKFNKKQ